MTAPVLALPSLGAWADSYKIGQFLRVFAPHWQATAEVAISFARCGFLTAEGAAILSVFKLTRDSWGGVTKLDPSGASHEIVQQLERWQVSQLFGPSGTPPAANAIPILHQTVLDPLSLEEYICTGIQEGQNMPLMTPALAKEVRRSFSELFLNVFGHSNSCCGGLTLGQLYPNLKHFQFCVCDGGVGMVNRIQQAGYGMGSPSDALEWAMGEGNSTRPIEAGPGGLGLFLLQEFVKINGGSLRIVANRGYWCQDGNVLTKRTLSAEFPGTLIQVKLLVRDDVIYSFAEEGGA